MKVLVAQSCPTLRPHGLQPIRLLCPWDSPGKNTRVGSQALLQGIFLTQRLNPGLLHCRQILYCLSHQGRPLQELLGTHIQPHIFTLLSAFGWLSPGSLLKSCTPGSKSCSKPCSPICGLLKAGYAPGTFPASRTGSAHSRYAINSF